LTPHPCSSAAVTAPHQVADPALDPCDSLSSTLSRRGSTSAKDTSHLIPPLELEYKL
jgi:hypothetical protein